jgi:bifunctional enzyme CysN/CysC
VLIDRVSNQTVAMGVIHYALRRSNNIVHQDFEIERPAREAQKKQKAAVLWFTGLSGSGKSTTANALEIELFARGCHTYVLDGDNVRGGLNRDLGFADADRVENIRRMAEVARLMADAGLIVMVCAISPFRSDRAMVRERMRDVEFVEIHMSTPLDVCERRDPKGLYKQARAGTLTNFTGVDSRYEPPQQAELVIDAAHKSAPESADEILRYLQTKNVI